MAAAVDQIRPIVTQRLRELEREFNLRVLFACESGSRAWGFASPDSDFDVRFIFVRPAADYIRLRPPTDAFDVHADDELDLAGWDVRKAAELLRKSNSPLLEWIESPIIYETDAGFHAQLRELRTHYFDRKKAMHHYLSLARGVWSTHIVGKQEPIRKKYLYVLRPLACAQYILEHHAQPPTHFEAVLEGIDLEHDVDASIRRLIADKKANHELGACTPDETLDEWITRMIDFVSQQAGSIEAERVCTGRLDRMLSELILSSTP